MCEVEIVAVSIFLYGHDANCSSTTLVLDAGVVHEVIVDERFHESVLVELYDLTAT